LEEVKMLAQTDQERERYESRRKAQLDYNTGLKVDRLEGMSEGELKGELKGEISKIQLCERLLKRPESSAEKLAALSLQELAQITRRLEEELSQK